VIEVNALRSLSYSENTLQLRPSYRANSIETQTELPLVKLRQGKKPSFNSIKPLTDRLHWGKLAKNTQNHQKGQVIPCKASLGMKALPTKNSLSCKAVKAKEDRTRPIKTSKVPSLNLSMTKHLHKSRKSPQAMRSNRRSPSEVLKLRTLSSSHRAKTLDLKV
jgi:hypothetical protein